MSMPTQYRQMIHQLPVSRLSLDVLFALAFILDECETQDTLEDEVDGLTFKYMQESLLPKWHQCVKEGLANYAWQHQEKSAEALINDILSKVQAVHENNQRYRDLLAKIKRVLHARSVVATPQQDLNANLSADWRKQVMALLLPAFTVYKPRKPQ